MSLSASVCSRLQHQHETIYELIRGFSEEQLRQRLQPDKWSAFEQLAHLVSYQPVFMQRLQKNTSGKRTGIQPVCSRQ